MWVQLAKAAIRRFKLDFPRHIQDVVEIEVDIQTAMEAMRAKLMEHSARRQQQSEQVCTAPRQYVGI